MQCRQFAEKLNTYYDVEILTTCAVDYVTWENEYADGDEYLNEVLVRRFPVDFRGIQKCLLRFLAIFSITRCTLPRKKKHGCARKAR